MSLLDKLRQQKAAMQKAADEGEKPLVPPRPARPAPEVKPAPELHTPPAQEPEPESPALRTSAPKPSFGGKLKVPGKLLAPKTLAKPAPKIEETPEPSTEPEPEPKEPSTALRTPAALAKPGGAIAGVLARAKPDLAPAAAEALDHGEVYSAAHFLADIQDLGDPPDADDEEQDAGAYSEALATIVRKATQRLNELLAQELNHLSTADTDQAAFKDMANIVRITFTRIKSAPTAWALLTLNEKSAVIKATIKLAEKRNSAAKSRPANAAKSASTAEEAIAAAGVSSDVLDDLLGSFSL